MNPELISPKIIRFVTVDSTNDVAKEFAKKPDSEGTVVVADTQTVGRGRTNRKWHSPKGGLYVSVILRPRDPRRPTDLAILAGVALAQAVKECMPKSVDITVKWPNDCLVNGKKVAGVLCEALGPDRNDFAVVGMGVNVNTPASELAVFKSTPFSATSFVTEAPGGKYDLAKVTDVLVRKLFALYQLYREEGFEPIRFIWEKNCRFLGKKIQITEVGKPGAPAVQGTFLGIDESGALVLSSGQGERRTYVTGEINCYWP